MYDKQNRICDSAKTELALNYQCKFLKTKITGVPKYKMIYILEAF